MKDGIIYPDSTVSQFQPQLLKKLEDGEGKRRASMRSPERREWKIKLAPIEQKKVLKYSEMTSSNENQNLGLLNQEAQKRSSISLSPFQKSVLGLGNPNNAEIKKALRRRKERMDKTKSYGKKKQALKAHDLSEFLKENMNSFYFLQKVEKALENRDNNLILTSPIPQPITKLFCFIKKYKEGSHSSLFNQYELKQAEEMIPIITCRRVSPLSDKSFSFCLNQYNSKPSINLGAMTHNIYGDSFELFEADRTGGKPSTIASIKFDQGEEIRRMLVITPDINENGDRAVIDSEMSCNSLFAISESKREAPLLRFYNLRPKYCPKKECTMIDIHRIGHFPSSDSFILTDQSNTLNCLSLGRISKSTYVMRICYPLSFFQGFAICIASIENKRYAFHQYFA